MKKILDIRHFIILFLLVCCVFIQHNKPAKEIVIKEVQSKPELIHDTIPQEVPVYLPGQPILKDTTIYVTTIEKVDTLAILKDYLVFNKFSDTLKLSNNQGFVYLNQTVNENKIVDRKFSATIKPKIVRETPPPPPPIRNQVFFGINGAVSREDWVNSIGLGLILRHRPRSQTRRRFRILLSAGSKSRSALPFASQASAWWRRSIATSARSVISSPSRVRLIAPRPRKVSKAPRSRRA